MVAYVVPDLVFAQFRQMGKADSELQPCKAHAAGEPCADCCVQYFDFTVFGIQTPGTKKAQSVLKQKLKLSAGERLTLNLNGEIERTVSIPSHAIC